MQEMTNFNKTMKINKYTYQEKDLHGPLFFQIPSINPTDRVLWNNWNRKEAALSACKFSFTISLHFLYLLYEKLSW